MKTFKEYMDATFLQIEMDILDKSGVPRDRMTAFIEHNGEILRKIANFIEMGIKDSTEKHKQRIIRAVELIKNIINKGEL